MSKTKFTPGPWKWHIDDYYESLYGSSDYPDYVVFSSLDYGSFSFNQNKHREANKALIAAAPELYEALEAIIKEAQEQGMVVKAVVNIKKIAKAATAKARGEV